MENYIRQYDDCRQNEKPFCTNRCPFHMDVLDFQTKMANNNYNAAYKTFRNAVAFPEVVAALCPEYCADVCPRAAIDQSVQLHLLEKTCVARVTKKDPTDYNIPIKQRKVAIIGAGGSGLACGVRLAQKKYDVTIFEKADRVGGTLTELLPAELVDTDIKRQFQFETYTLHLNREIGSLEDLADQGFEAVYVATGKDGSDFGVLCQEGFHCLLQGNQAVFAGGSLAGRDKVQAIAEGLDMAWSIEVYLKTGKLEYPETVREDRVVVRREQLSFMAPVIPGESGIYTDEEASSEAARCIRCQCDACMVYCDVSLYHKKWPLKIRDEVMATVAASESMLHKSPARRMIGTCTQCGLCTEVCPSQIDVGGMLLEARKMLHKQGKMPGAYHQFWLNDMEFAGSDDAAITKPAPETESCEYAFFPGCQLGAADPDYVTAPYGWLLEKNSSTGLLLRCCGLPAEWAGDEALHQQELDQILKDWESLGKPTLIMACAACLKHFKSALPEIPVVSLYEILDQWQEESWPNHRKEEIFSVFDPCTARNNQSIQEAVRSLSNRCGTSWEELPQGDRHGCCGYGGHVSEANGDYARFIARQRIGLSENPYLVYCINCRDIFRAEGKSVHHMLDLLFDIGKEERPLPNLTERRSNRVLLKETLLKEIWGEAMSKKPEACPYHLILTPAVQEKMNRLKLLEQDLSEVIAGGEKSSKKTFNKEKQTYSAYKEMGHITCWVEYRRLDPDDQKEEPPIEVLNVYTHRMKIKLEGVWNGIKIDTDL